MKVLFLSSWFPSQKHPLNGNFVIRHAESVSLFHSVTILNISSDPLSDKRILGISPQIDFIEKTYKPSRIPLIGNIINRLQYFKLFIQSVKQLKRERNLPDVIHVNVIYPIGILALYLKWKYQIAFIITEHWTGYLSQRSQKLSLMHRFFAKVICRQATYICPVSSHLAQSMQSLGFEGNYKVVANVVNVGCFKTAESRKNIKKRLVHISTLDEVQKNVTGLLNVVKRLKQLFDFEFIIVSENPFDLVKRHMSKIGLSEEAVVLKGPFSPQQVADLLCESDLFVLFSRYENLPCVIAESLVAGTPVVSTNVGGIVEMINDSNGHLVQSEDEESLFLWMKDFLSDQLVFNAQTIQQNAIKTYSYQNVGAAYSRLYASTKQS